MDSLYRLIRDRIETSPDRVALMTGDRQLTYAQLGHRIDALASRLRRTTAGPEPVIAVYVEHPATAIVSTLAVWAVGAAYLPLVPELPDAMVRTWLDHARVETIIVERGQAARVTALTDARRVFADVTDTDDVPDTAFDGPRDGRDLAYVMYTSGSTGVPKAVAVEHRNLSSYVAALPAYAPLTEHDIVLQLAAFTFDPWLRDALIPLAAGAAVVARPTTNRRDPESVLAAIRTHRVTRLLSATPALLSALLSAPSFETDPPAVESTLVSGESFLPLHSFGSALKHFGRLINHFGLTETTLAATWHAVVPDPDARTDPIGIALPGVAVHLLDAQLRPVPPGTVGDIHIGGDGVSRGYLHAPAMTAGRFVADPFGGPGVRLYRTGDLGRRLPDGTLEYLGRRDRQINLRGHRVEPAEIELALTGHPAVRAAVVVRHRRPIHGTILVAYLVAQGVSAPSNAELRRHLGTRLPAHMIPATFVLLPELPVGATGKVDRSALPQPVFEGHADDSPRSPRETTIADAWSATLGIGAVGRHDNFFDLGGHSLVAAAIATRLSKALDLACTTEHILRHPTVAALAVNLPDSAPGPAIIRRTGTGFPMTLVQRGLLAAPADWADDALLGPTLARAFRLTGPLDHRALADSVSALVRGHAMLRCEFPIEPGGVPDQIVRHRVPVPISIQTVTPAELAPALTTASLDRTVTNPLDITVFELSDAEHVVLVRCRRLAVDESAFDVLIRELGECYGTARPPADAAPHYPGFSHANTPPDSAVQEALRYWTSRLGDDTEQPPDRTHLSEAPLALPSNVVRPLHVLARAHRLAFAHVLQVALAASITAVTASSRPVVLAAQILRRPTPESTGAVGPFSFLRGGIFEPAAHRSLPELLALSPAWLRDTLPYNDIPLEYLCGALGLPMTALTNRFVLRPAGAEPLHLAGLSVSTVELPAPRLFAGRVLDLTETAGALTGTLTSSHDGVDGARRIAEELHRLLTDAALSPTPDPLR